MSSGQAQTPVLRFVTLSTHIWGAENTLLTLATALEAENAAKLQLVAPDGPLLEEWTARHLGSSIALPDSYSNINGRAALLASQPRLTLFLSRLPRVDFVHSHHQWTHIPVAYSSSCPTVLDLHDFVPTFFGRLLQNVAVLRASQSMVASETVRKQLSKKFRAKTTILNRPVAQPANRSKESHSPLSLPTLTFIVVCRPDPNKGFMHAIKPLLNSMERDDKLVVVGGTANQFDPQLSIASDPRIQFHGRLQGDDLEEAWRQADVHILTSEFEPFGRVVVEAAIRGLPSIVHSCAGAASSVESSGSGIVLADWQTVGERIRDLRSHHFWEGLEARLERLVELHDPLAVADIYRRNVVSQYESYEAAEPTDGKN